MNGATKGSGLTADKMKKFPAFEVLEKFITKNTTPPPMSIDQQSDEEEDADDSDVEMPDAREARALKKREKKMKKMKKSSSSSSSSSDKKRPSAASLDLVSSSSFTSSSTSAGVRRKVGLVASRKTAKNGMATIFLKMKEDGDEAHYSALMHVMADPKHRPYLQTLAADLFAETTPVQACAIFSDQLSMHEGFVTALENIKTFKLQCDDTLVMRPRLASLAPTDDDSDDIDETDAAKKKRKAAAKKRREKKRKAAEAAAAAAGHPNLDRMMDAISHKKKQKQEKTKTKKKKKKEVKVS